MSVIGEIAFDLFKATIAVIFFNYAGILFPLLFRFLSRLRVAFSRKLDPILIFFDKLFFKINKRVYSQLSNYKSEIEISVVNEKIHFKNYVLEKYRISKLLRVSGTINRGMYNGFIYGRVDSDFLMLEEFESYQNFSPLRTTSYNIPKSSFDILIGVGLRKGQSDSPIYFSILSKFLPNSPYSYYAKSEYLRELLLNLGYNEDDIPENYS